MHATADRAASWELFVGGWLGALRPQSSGDFSNLIEHGELSFAEEIDWRLGVRSDEQGGHVDFESRGDGGEAVDAGAHFGSFHLAYVLPRVAGALRELLLSQAPQKPKPHDVFADAETEGRRVLSHDARLFGIEPRPSTPDSSYWPIAI